MYRVFIILTLVYACILSPQHALGQTTNIPNRVDILVNANTSVPSFYLGHRLPSSGSTITLTALPSIQNTISPKSYRYLWKRDGKVQNGGISSALNTFSFSTTLELRVTVSVDVVDANGRTVVSNTQLIPIVTPEIYFYEQNPLQGLLLNAVPNSYTIIGDEVTLRAYGYFMDSTITADNLSAVWSINDRKVIVGEDPYLITLQKQNQLQKSQLIFHLRNLQELLQGGEKSVTLNF